MTNEEMRNEIDRLKKSEYVAIAQNSEQEKLKRMLYKYRWLDKKGRKIVETMGEKTK